MTSAPCAPFPATRRFDARREFSFRRLLTGFFAALSLLGLASVAEVAAAPKSILLVDDDFSENNNPKKTGPLSGSDQVYRKLLDEIAATTGAKWTVEVVDSYSDGPNLEHLRGNDVVIWYTGASIGGSSDNTAVVSKNDEAALVAYLNTEGGTVVILSPGYAGKVLAGQGWDNATWPFLRSVLGLKGGYGLVQRFKDSTVVGADGKSYLIKAKAATDAQFSVVNPDQAKTLFSFTSSGKALDGKPAAVATVNPVGKGQIVYVGFTLENLSTEDASAVFHQLLTSAGVDLSSVAPASTPTFTAATPVPTPAAGAVISPSSPAFRLGKLNETLKPGALAIANPNAPNSSLPPIAIATGPTPAPTPPPVADPGTARPVAQGNGPVQNFVAPTTAPVGSPPTNLHFSSDGPAFHSVMWQGQGWTSFRVYRKYNDGWRLLAEDVHAPGYYDETLVPPNTAYRVVMVHADKSEGSVEGVFVAPMQPQIPPNLKAVQSGPGKVKVTWDNPNSAPSWQVYGPGLPDAGIAIKTPTIELAGVSVGTHQIRVATYYKTELSSLTAVTTVTVKTDRNRYRISMLGLYAATQTADDPLQSDGKGDEVYAGAMWAKIAPAGDVAPGGFVRTVVYGDTQGFPDRIRAGSAGPTGGIKTGDTVPAVDGILPLAGRSTANDRFPLLIWDGELVDGVDTLVVAPVLFEWDNGSSAAWDNWTQWWSTPNGSSMLGDRARRHPGPEEPDKLSALSNPWPGSHNNSYDSVVKIRTYGPDVPSDGDRPIGEVNANENTGPFDQPNYGLLPRGFVFTRDSIEQLLVSQSPARIEAHFWDTLSNAGRYWMYLQVERIDGPAPVTPVPTSPPPLFTTGVGSTAKTLGGGPAVVTFTQPGTQGKNLSTSMVTPTPPLLKTVAPTSAPIKLGPTVTPPPVGAAPTNLTITSSGPASHTLNWSSAPVRENNVYRKDPDGWHLIADKIHVQGYIDENFIPPGTAYRVEVVYTTNAVGMAEITYASPPQPGVVTELQAVQTGPGKVKLSWKYPTGAQAAYVFGDGLPAAGVKTAIGPNNLELTGLAVGSHALRVAISYGSKDLPAPGTANTSVLVNPDHGTYRVVVLGVKAIHPTADTPLQTDGKGDEIYLGAYWALVDRRTDAAASGSVRTNVYGDTNGFPTRIRAGSAGSTGGIVGGDIVPSGADFAAKAGMAVNTDRFPVLAWQGDLSDTGAILAFAPALFEWDDGAVYPWNSWLDWWSTPRGSSDLVIRVHDRVGDVLGQANQNRALTTRHDLPADSTGYVGWAYNYNSVSPTGDRLIGVEDKNWALVGTASLTYIPSGLVMTHQNVEALLAGHGNAVVVEYAVSDTNDPTSTRPLQGSYIIYLQIERVSAGPTGGAPASTPVVAPR